MAKNLIALQNRFLGHGRTIYDDLSNLFDEQGYLSDEDILRIADEFHLPPQYVRSTAKFYSELAHDRPAARVIKLCNGEACRAAGSATVEREVTRRLGNRSSQEGEDAVRLEHVGCLGFCGRGPNALVDGQPVSLADVSHIDRLCDSVEHGSPHGLPEPRNDVFLPTKGAPRILMRHFDEDVLSVDDARATGVYSALERAVTQGTPEQVLDEVMKSQLRGRGGAGFPTGIKLQTVARCEAEDGSGRRFVVANFDEGDAGSYSDKELVERDPHSLLEGILLAAYACGAGEAIIYTRFEYPRAQRILNDAIRDARQAGIIGARAFDSEFHCDVRAVRGQGAYICGEETSLLRSLEGLPALVRTRPPYPAQKGLWDCPTAVLNVETLHNLPWIVEHGGDAYAQYGFGRSRGTKAVSLNTRVKRPGVYEVELGTTLREIVFDMAGGMAEGQTFKAIQVGGPLGGILPERLLDTRLDFESMAAAKGMLGHGGIVVYSAEDDLVEIARGLMYFCAVESCGKCFPCRIGSVRGTELFDQIMEHGATEERLTLLEDLCEAMRYGSLCALGGMTPAPIETVLEYFPEEIDRYRH